MLSGVNLINAISKCSEIVLYQLIAVESSRVRELVNNCTMELLRSE